MNYSEILNFDLIDSPKCLMLVGPPCSGKSTFVDDMHLEDGEIYWKIASTDNIIDQWSRQYGKTYNDCFQMFFSDAEKCMSNNIDRWIMSKENIIWDQTNLKPTGRQSKLQKLPASYYKVGVFFVDIDVDLLLSRNNRPGKIIPEHIVRSMAQAYKVPDKIEPWFNTHIYVSAQTGEVRDRL